MAEILHTLIPESKTWSTLIDIEKRIKRKYPIGSPYRKDFLEILKNYVKENYRGPDAERFIIFNCSDILDV